MDKKEFGKKALAVASAVGLIAGGLAGATLFPVEKTETVEVLKNVTVEKEVPVEVIKEVEVVKEVEKIVEVPVDNENLDLVLEHVYDNNGNVEYLTEDLKDSEISEIVDRIVFVNDIKSLAVAEVKSELADLVDKEVVDGVELDDRDVEKIRVDSDDDEVIVSDIDFDDKDATVMVTGNFKHDDVDYVFEVEVEIRDGSVEDVELVSVQKE